MKKTGFIFMAILYSLNVFSQGEVLSAGHGGYHVSGQLGSGEGYTIVGLSSGYTSAGGFSLGVTLGLEHINDYDISGTAIRPYLGYRVVNQGVNDMPINVTVGTSYQYSTYKDLDLTANSFGLHCGISHEIRTSGSLVIIPGASLGWSKTNFDLYGYSEGISGLGFGIWGGLWFDKFYLAPQVGFSDGNSNFNLMLGMFFQN